VNVLVVGAGGHARVCLEILHGAGHHVIGCLSRDGRASVPLRIAIVGRDDDLEARIAAGDRHVFVAVGDNRSRLAVGARVEAAGGTLVTAVSPHAIVSREAVVGAGSVLMPGAVVNPGTVLGRLVIVNTNASVDHDGDVGDGAHIAPGAAVAGGVRLGTGVLLGIGSCVIPGVTIGEHATVGAGAAVIFDVEAHTTVGGVPARPLAPEAGPR
jgi:UDP-perosamine 4-acetyltransferase